MVFGGSDESHDARRVRREISLSVLPALRDAVSDLATVNRSPLTGILRNNPPDPDLLEAAATAIDTAMDDLAEDENLGQVASNLDTRVATMAGPQLDLNPTLGFASRKPSQLLRSIRLFVDADRTRNVVDASTGSANVLYLALLLEQISSRRAGDKIVDEVLAVEEPEAHLHPVLQRHLFRYLLRDSPSLILTTHSPHIAAVAPLGSLILLRRGKQGETVAGSVANVALDAAQTSDLERYLDVTRAEILFSRLVILVEGPAELYLLPAIASIFGFDFDAYGIVIANVQGIDFAPYRRLLAPKGLGVPSLVLTDGDRTAHRGFLGLLRAARLSRDKELSNAVTEGVTALRTLGPDRAQENALREQLGQAGLFVGRNTLETDIIALFGNELRVALQEFYKTKPVLDEIAASVGALAKDSDASDAHSALLERIEYIGKGRFAQRLASRLEEITYEDLIQSIEELAGRRPSQEDLSPLFSIDGGYLVGILEMASQMMRGYSIFVDEDEDEEHGGEAEELSQADS